MKATDVRAMSADQLNDELAKLKKEQFNLRFQRATGQLENTSRVREAALDEDDDRLLVLVADDGALQDSLRHRSRSFRPWLLPPLSGGQWS